MLKDEIISNFYYVQDLIEDIKRKEKIDIKDISDLHKFVDMQRQMILTLKELG